MKTSFRRNIGTAESNQVITKMLKKRPAVLPMEIFANELDTETKSYAEKVTKIANKVEFELSLEKLADR